MGLLQQAEQGLGVAVGRTGEQRQDADQSGRPPFGQPTEAVTRALSVQGKSSEHVGV
jgi:hypothetical protein